MRVRVVTILLLFVGVIVVGSEQASAASVSVSGTEITVTSTVEEEIRFTCGSGSTVRVNGAATSPTLACSALTKVTVTSINSTDQTVRGEGLNATAFTANPKLTVSLGGGADTVYETDQADTLALGAGADSLRLALPTVSNVGLDLGLDAGDGVEIRTINASETTTATSTNNSLLVNVTSTGGASNITVLNAEILRIDSLSGDDDLVTTGITAASSIDEVELLGGAGNDEFTTGVVSSQLLGGTGTNEYNGGSGDDVAVTASQTDDIALGGGVNRVLDTSTPQSGGRTVAPSGGDDTWYLGHYPGDSTTRINPGTAGATVDIIASLARPGLQVVNGYETIEVSLNVANSPAARSVIDVIPTGASIDVTGKGGANELLDVTIPNGGWSANTINGVTTIDPSNPNYGEITAKQLSQFRVHAPWSDKNEGFAHRLTRDLLFRFPSDTERNALADQIQAGTKTPATAVKGLMNTDEYRGIDVDRVFVKYLRRVPDPGGRTYWINSLRNGKALWRFRAQLFGSNEYFSKAGGTNSAYVIRAYTDVLGRAPDPSGQTYWTNKLENGADRGQVALQFINSPEARRRLVDDQYLRFLERFPTNQERDPWVAKLPTATGELDLIAALASSTSYYEYD